MQASRRKLLTLAGLGVLGGAVGYAYIKGVRYPILALTPGVSPTATQQEGIEVYANGAVYQGTTDDGSIKFRAYVPEPSLDIRVSSGRRWRLLLENIHPDATLAIDTPPGLSEERNNLTRIVEAESKTDGSWQLNWRFPKQDAYRFTVIGDTGGGTELDWVLTRSVELGADFIVHLGDLNYDKGDLHRAAEAFNKASIPSFVAIGNHDFREGWQPLYEHFTQLIGPRNSSFRLGGIQFLNLDTATDFWPPDRGARLRLLQQFPIGEPDPAVQDFVVFTHRPLNTINGPGEADWLRKQLLNRGVNSLLAGHNHIKSELDDGGLHTFISGQGLAHADLIVGRPIAEILVADVMPGQRVHFHWAPLNMQLEAHCNSRNWGVLEVLDKPEPLARLQAVCKK
ncbi:MAG: metallophosphoesterase [Arenicellales bacterium]|nr:metallophosphoesterase [Arenicellales bacterium]